MKSTLLLLTAASALLLAGCVVGGPGVKAGIPVPGVKVVAPGGGAVHCPPGQAKKGNC